MAIGCVAALVSYTLVLLPFALIWIRPATHAFPAGALLVAPSDGPLIAWVLGWVGSALTAAPGVLFDAPVSYPAPAQLAGTEHFLSSQIVFLPVYALTGNALLGANVVALASYPLAAVAMQRLLIALGCAGATAWVGGLVFALGPMRVPGNLQLIQYLNLYLPAVALLILRLRERATLGAACALAAVFALGLFSSYYLAIMLGLLAGIWTLLELRSPAPRRARFLLLAAGAAGAGMALLAIVSLPYFVRPEAVGQSRNGLTLVGAYLRNADVPGVREVGAYVAAGFPNLDADVLGSRAFLVRAMVGSVRVFLPGWFGLVPLALAACGVLALRARSASARTLARRGCLVCAIATPLMFLPVEMLAGHQPRSLLGAILTAPLRVFRYPYRTAVLAGFGTTLLGAAALEALRHRLGRRAGVLAAAAAGLAVLGTRGPDLAGHGMHEVPDPPIYDTLREVARTGEHGPVLELPVADPSGRPLERQAMLGSLRHGLPLVTGATGYPALHRAVLDDALGRLPTPAALARIVDLTHVRWLVLRPAAQWPAPLVREGLLAIDWVVPVAERDGWVLARIDRAADHAEWYRTVAAGRVPAVPPLAPMP